ncbi:MAG: VOC family protein [Gemmatimonadetes bacterium]|nr:VOC family protein [Gemmatimonadota bacterium]
MPSAYKPHGYTSLAPYLLVSGAHRVLEFLTAAFGATALRRFEAPDGSILQAGNGGYGPFFSDTVVMLSEGGGPYPPFPAWVHLYLPDVDAAYARALAAGGRAVQAPEQKPGDPDRRGGVADPAGNTWWISTQMG